MSFVIMKDALKPYLEPTLLDSNGDPVDLTGKTATFRMKRVGETTWKIATTPSNATIIGNGKVRYTWSTGDTDTNGDFEAQFGLTESGKTEWFPTAAPGYLPVTVLADDRSELPTLVFCTPAQSRMTVLRDVDLNYLALAQTVISMRTGVPAETGVSDPPEDDDVETYYDSLDDQDKIGLRQAVSFTAAWLEDQPDYLTRLNVKSESVQGEARTYSPGALEIPPLAEWALSNTRFADFGGRTVDTPRVGFSDARELIPYAERWPERGWRRW